MTEEKDIVTNIVNKKYMCPVHGKVENVFVFFFGEEPIRDLDRVQDLNIDSNEEHEQVTFCLHCYLRFLRTFMPEIQEIKEES